MTEEEADALEEMVTRNPPKVDPAKARRPLRMIAVDDLTAEYLTIRAAATRQTPEEVLGSIVSRTGVCHLRVPKIFRVEAPRRPWKGRGGPGS
jgi:hypothetical protein